MTPRIGRTGLGKNVVEAAGVKRLVRSCFHGLEHRLHYPSTSPFANMPLLVR